jgi:hypothetical protein
VRIADRDSTHILIVCRLIFGEKLRAWVAHVLTSKAILQPMVTAESLRVVESNTPIWKHSIAQMRKKLGMAKELERTNFENADHVAFLLHRLGPGLYALHSRSSC